MFAEVIVVVFDFDKPSAFNPLSQRVRMRHNGLGALMPHFVQRVENRIIFLQKRPRS